MGKLRRLQPVAVALLLVLLLSSCAATKRTILRRHKPITGTSPALKSASLDDLNGIIAHAYDGVHSFAATVTLSASSGSVYQGRIVDYTSLPGHILFSKPDDIRIQANVPFVGALAFDMVSNGSSFRLNRENKEFITGLNSAPAHSANKIENLRPQAFLSSLLIRPWNQATESVMLKDDTDEDDALYRLEFNGKAANGLPVPGREVWFDRQDLTIVRQKVYDPNGNIVSDTSYSQWKTFNGVPFPSHIDINRRMDEYGVVIEILKMEMNKELTPAQFDLEQPEGVKVRVIDSIPKLVWENIRFRPLRTLLSVLLIGVPVMLILTLVGVSQGFMDDSQQRTRGVGADIIVRPANSSFTSGSSAPIPAAAVGRLAQEAHVAQATGVVQALTGKLWDSMNGIDYAAFKRMSGGFTFIEGDDANAFQHPGDILVDTSYAAEQHPKLHAGSTIKILNKVWRVTGVVETGKLGHVFASIGDLQDLTSSPGKVSQIYLKLDDEKNTDAVISSLKQLIPEYSVYSVREWIALTNVDRIPAVGIFVKVIVGIGVFTGLIVVSLSMYMAVLQRTREIGILKSLGATKGFVMQLILWEAGFMGVGGTIAGILLSFASKAALKQFVPASLPQAIVVDWWWRVLLIALGSALLGAIYPGMIAVRQDPIEALSYE